MTNTTTMLSEVALNSREVSHEDWGTFIIKRPTNKILSLMESTKTRSLNRDMQEKEKVYDPIEEQYKLVPAFLTKTGKAKILEEYGDWTEDDRAKLREYETTYRNACIDLERTGFQGVNELEKDYKEAYDELLSVLKKKEEDFEEELPILFPMEYDRESVDPEEFAKARGAVERKAKDNRVSEVLQAIDTCHKQFELVLKAMAAQSDLFVLKIKEIELFSDTVEMRAENRARLVKLVHCVLDEDGERIWQTTEECEDDNPDKIAWLLEKLEKFERLDDQAEKATSKYNFLSPLLSRPEQRSEESPDSPPSSSDGLLAEKTEETS